MQLASGERGQVAADLELEENNEQGKLANIREHHQEKKLWQFQLFRAAVTLG